MSLSDQVRDLEATIKEMEAIADARLTVAAEWVERARKAEARVKELEEQNDRLRRRIPICSSGQNCPWTEPGPPKVCPQRCCCCPYTCAVRRSPATCQYPGFPCPGPLPADECPDAPWKKVTGRTTTEWSTRPGNCTIYIDGTWPQPPSDGRTTYIPPGG